MDVDVAEDKPVAEVISEVVSEEVLVGGELEVVVAYPRARIIAATKTALA